MSRCLSEDRIQAAADREATAAETSHVERCASCAARVDRAREAVHAFRTMMDAAPVPPSLEGRVAAAMREADGPRRRGATTLRAERAPGAWLRPAWLSAAGAVAAAAIVALVVMPSVDRGSELSAMEIIDRSIATLSPSATELLEYELSLTTPPGWNFESGTYRVEQVIEHDGPGRWRLSRFDASGVLLNGVSENPDAGQRRAFVRLDGRGYAFEFQTNAASRIRLGQMQREYAEAAMRIIQAATRHTVRTEEDAAGKRFVIELPDSAEPRPAGPALLWDLAGARLVVDANDYHVLALRARGIYMGRPVSIAYRLLRRELRASGDIAQAEFDLPIEPGAIEIHGEGTAHPPRDVAVALLREVARGRQ